MLCVDEKGRVCQDRYHEMATQLFGLGKSKRQKRRDKNNAAAREAGYANINQMMAARKAGEPPPVLPPPPPVMPQPGTEVVQQPVTSLSPTYGPGVVNTTPTAPVYSSPLPTTAMPSAGSPSYQSYQPQSAIDSSESDTQAQADARAEMEYAAMQEEAEPGEIPEYGGGRRRRGSRAIRSDEMMRDGDPDEGAVDLMAGVGTYILSQASPPTMTVKYNPRSWADAFKGALDFLPWGKTEPFKGTARIEHRKRPVYSPEEQMSREANAVSNATERDPFGLGAHHRRRLPGPAGQVMKRRGGKHRGRSRGSLPPQIYRNIEIKENRLPFDSSRLSGLRGTDDGYTTIVPQDGMQNLGDFSASQNGVAIAAGGLIATYLSGVVPGKFSGILKIAGIGATAWGVLELFKPAPLDAATQSSANFPTDQLAEDVKISAGFIEPARGGQAQFAAMHHTYRMVFSVTNRGDKPIKLLEVTVAVEEFSKLLLGLIPIGGKTRTVRQYVIENLNSGESKTVEEPNFPFSGDVADLFLHKDGVATLMVKRSKESVPEVAASTSFTL